MDVEEEKGDEEAVAIGRKSDPAQWAQETPLTLHEMRRIHLTRTRMIKLCHEPFFADYCKVHTSTSVEIV